VREKQPAAHAEVAFSATLSPQHGTRTRLGLDEHAVSLRADSPFSPQQLQVTLVTDIDTRFAQRAQSAAALAATIARWLSDRDGNCIIYFPSYAYLEQILEQPALAELGAQRSVWQQSRGGGQVAEQALLDLLEERRDVAAFCILGGIFGEGVDLPGDRLRSVVIVGVGMPQINRDTRTVQAWYEAQYGEGFDFTFVYPGMQKVDQALGRVVRTLDDNGAALLIDPRYREARYRALLPHWWHYETAGSELSPEKPEDTTR
jgi:DNA excision repair protein ERCC-2